MERGRSDWTGLSAADPDGAWSVREGDHREANGPSGKPLRKLLWALEATIATMGRGPGAVPAHPNLAVGLAMARPGVDPAGTGVRVLARVRARGFAPGYLGADRGYTQGLPTRFHLPVRSLGYRLVMDYRAEHLGRQANSQGASLVDGTFYCPARGDHPEPCCPLRPEVAGRHVGKVPVLSPPETPPKICTQSAVTIAPDVGARFRQDLAYGSEAWASTDASYRNTIEGLNGYVKDPAHEALAQPGRRRVRGIAAQSLFVTFLLMAANVRKVATFRQMVEDHSQHRVAERARRRRTSLADRHSSA